jgi:hypothetical protein
MTIPATNSKLLVAEDWVKIYQSFRNADFQSYDFETLRRSMINYLQQTYPEDFNDYIDSSEYMALIEVIAYLGQNLSFRIDLNARENFLETAQRRNSILQLAQLISYVPSRNLSASGLLKIVGVSTTDNVIDINGINLANSAISWNDYTNNNWYSQFITVLNSAMNGAYVFGTPYDKGIIGGIPTEEYAINSSNTDVPVYTFSKNINGTSMVFEIVPATFSDSSFIYEKAPIPGGAINFLYQNDNQGASSPNTGFFMYFKQGTVAATGFSIDTPVPNEIVGINASNINNTDTWLWQLDANGNYSNLWTQVPDIVGNNVIYNSLDQNQRNIFSIRTRDQDQIDLNFADGSFGNLPKGRFQFFYRTSNGLSYTIRPDQMSGISLKVPYFNKSGQGHTLTLTLALQYTVANASSTESNASIKTKAPQAYYTQNRMVTAEDYNITPLTVSSSILKLKSIARSTSGLSKYFDLNDATGKYSSTNIFASDGILYKSQQEENFQFTFTSKNDIFSVIKKQIEDILVRPGIRSFYLDNWPRALLTDFDFSWNLTNKVSGQSQGYLYDSNNKPLSLGSYSNSNLIYVTPGALLQFDGNLWATVLQVVGDGSNNGLGNLYNGQGPLVLSTVIPNGSLLTEIIPVFINKYSYAFESELVSICLNHRNFGLTFDTVDRTWAIITDTNLDLTSPFSLNYHRNLDNLNLDASWLISFNWVGNAYKVRYRFTDYVFESKEQTSFYFNNSVKNYDFTNNKVLKDQIIVLSTNPDLSFKNNWSNGTIDPDTLSVSNQLAFGINGDFYLNTVDNTTFRKIRGRWQKQPIGQALDDLGQDYVWQIDNSIVQSDGYVEPKRVKVSFYENTQTRQIDNPDGFVNIVPEDNYVYFKLSTDTVTYYLYTGEVNSDYATSVDATNAINAGLVQANLGDLFYFYDPAVNVVKSYTPTAINLTDPWTYESEYLAYSGRADLKIHYIHNSGENIRIDPSKSNIIDIYMLTSDYNTSFRNWLISGVGSEPAVPTSASLESNYSAKLELVKSISDQIVYQPVKYKILFGSTAELNLQAIFKAVQSRTSTASANSITSRILDAINDFFALENWDFGESFYFSELTTYVMNLLTPDITNFVIVPSSSNSGFGSLYEVACQSSEIFISGATAANIQVIGEITASQLNSKNQIITNGS